MSDRDIIAAHTDEGRLFNMGDPDSLIVRCSCGVECGPRRGDHAAHVAAALRESRTVRAPLDLARMPDGTVIVGPDGNVGEKRDWPLDLAVNYLDGTTRTNSNIPLPARVLYVPGEPDEDGAL